MKLDNDMIRELLLLVEEQSTFSSSFRFPGTFQDEEVSAKVIEKLRYHMDQCIRSGLIRAREWSGDGFIFIEDLTPAGHEFLANIREDANWGKIKERSIKVGSTSLAALKDIAVRVIASIISDQFKGLSGQ